jgi:hypothetical protein
MTDYIFQHSRAIPTAMLSDMHQGEAGKPVLQIRAYYYKDARRRGLKLSIFRAVETDFGFCHDMMNSYNGLVHLADLPRKPTPKVAALWADRIAAQLEAVAVVALASDKPDWQQIANLFANIDA